MKNELRIISLLKSLPENCVFDQFPSPLGNLTLIASNDGLHALLWDYDWLHKKFNHIRNEILQNPNQKYISETKKQLEKYFQGKQKKFNIPLVLKGTDFQKKSWNKLKTIPYGKTISYQEQAIALGDKNKVRAIGSANGKNPISIIIPCHRVIGKDGNLHGFAGGLDAKKYLLELENKNNNYKT
ncbi:MAG: glycosyltransferase [Bdellovibrionaceae bacterium]|nr:glycosyltransferase [Pseudobdellovibrionaceae bacterium]